MRDKLTVDTLKYTNEVKGAAGARSKYLRRNDDTEYDSGSYWARNPGHTFKSAAIIGFGGIYVLGLSAMMMSTFNNQKKKRLNPSSPI